MNTEPTSGVSRNASPGDRLPASQGSSHFSQCAKTSREKMQRCIADYPVASVMTALGAGVACGLVIGVSLARPSHRTWRSSTADMGRRIIEAVSSAVPEALRPG